MLGECSVLAVTTGVEYQKPRRSSESRGEAKRLIISKEETPQTNFELIEVYKSS